MKKKLFYEMRKIYIQNSKNIKFHIFDKTLVLSTFSGKCDYSNHQIFEEK